MRIEKQRLIVTAAPNSSAEAREGAATVTNAEGGEAVLTIRQAGIPAAYGITLEPASLTFASSGDGLTKTVSVVTQGSVPAALVTSDQAEWLSAEIVEKQLLVTATVNDGGERRGEVTVTNAEGAYWRLRSRRPAIPVSLSNRHSFHSGRRAAAAPAESPPEERN